MDNRADEEFAETWRWWCFVNGGWDYAVRVSGDHRVIEQVEGYIADHGPQKLTEEQEHQFKQGYN